MARLVPAFLALLLVAACTSAPPAVTPTPAIQVTPGPTAVPATPSASAAPTATNVSPAPTVSAPPTPTVSADALAGELIQSGVLNVCVALLGAPAAELTADGQLDGYNISFAREIGARLGLKAEFRQALFEELLDLVAGHDCDISIASHNITASRLERVSLVPYTRSEQPVVVTIGNPQRIDSLDALCGLAVSASTGSTHVDLVRGVGDYADEGLNDGCAGAGRDPIDLHAFPTELEAVTALLDGEVVAYLGNPGFALDHPDDLQYAQTTLPPARQGIAVALDHPRLLAEVESAFEAMLADGTYREILASHLPNDESIDRVSIGN